jgi:hypothetical protein
MKLVIGLIAFLFACSQPTADGGNGSDGPQGLTGPQGPVGPQGPAGMQGPAGPQGAKGDKGDPGTAGPAGSTGPQGPQGPQGTTGPMGPQGFSGTNGSTGPQGPQGPAGATGPQGATGPSGAAGVPGLSIRVIDRDGQELGFPIPWRGSNGITESAILMHRDNPPASFPEGWVMPEVPPATIYYTGLGCIGTAMAKPAAAASYGPVLYSNYLYWVPGYSIIYKKVGSISAPGSSLRNNGICVNASTTQQTFDVLADSGFTLQLENTKPWTAAAQ